jgi:pimeloyl-ACP methyl ester carboxylesterase
MVADTVSLLEFLRDRFGGKTYVAGFSFGGTVGGYAAARRPDLVATLVAVGMDIACAAAGAGAYDFALAAARQCGSRRATRQLQAICPPPHLTSKRFATRVRWATNFGGGSPGCSLARSGSSPCARRKVLNTSQPADPRQIAARSWDSRWRHNKSRGARSRGHAQLRTIWLRRASTDSMAWSSNYPVVPRLG